MTDKLLARRLIITIEGNEIEAKTAENQAVSVNYSTSLSDGSMDDFSCQVINPSTELIAACQRGAKLKCTADFLGSPSDVFAGEISQFRVDFNQPDKLLEIEAVSFFTSLQSSFEANLSNYDVRDIIKEICNKVKIPTRFISGKDAHSLDLFNCPYGLMAVRDMIGQCTSELLRNVYDPEASAGCSFDSFGALIWRFPDLFKQEIIEQKAVLLLRPADRLDLIQVSRYFSYQAEFTKTQETHFINVKFTDLSAFYLPNVKTGDYVNLSNKTTLLEGVITELSHSLAVNTGTDWKTTLTLRHKND